MGQEANRIEQQIEDTRSEMSETIQEISRRADLPARLKSIMPGANHRFPAGLAISFAAGLLTGVMLVVKTRSGY
ncbi:MAG: DUF3618 domain-containing protein [Thermoleophilia bacterium]